MPEHWDVERLKSVFSLVTRSPREEDEIVTAFRDGTVTLRKNRREDGFTNAFHEHGYQRIEKGDLIIHAMDAFAGAIGVSDSEGKSTPVYSVCVPRSVEHNPRYFGYLLRSMAMSGYVTALAKGIRERSTEFRWKEAANVVLSVPPCNEQDSIVATLDRETAKIDELVAEQQRLMELLKEKRQAVISHAVTKGLNPDAPMKPSGVEWLGEVPAHWIVGPLKFLVDPDGGIQMGPFGGMLLDLRSDDTGYKVFGQENTISGDFSLGARWIDSQRYTSLQSYWLESGDIVLTRKGSLGNARLVGELPSPGIIDSDTIRVRVDHSRLRRDYLAVLFHEAEYVKHQITQAQRGAILPGVNSTTISNIVLALPPMPEQAEIMESLVRGAAMFEEQIGSVQRAVELLVERRTSIISAAVTGQIDVRHLAPEAAA
ncbi:MAG: hypothetical protein SFU57_00105 [Gemmatimonadales bacterium]|nr:hypothetical protein [Gemmatimonadales bacterium]